MPIKLLVVLLLVLALVGAGISFLEADAATEEIAVNVVDTLVQLAALLVIVAFLYSSAIVLKANEERTPVQRLLIAAGLCILVSAFALVVF